MTDTAQTIPIPKLLKARVWHSRAFAAVVGALLLFSQPWLSGGNVLRELMLWLGYVLILIGAFGRVYCSAYIGGRKNDVVVRSGPFSIVRNPLYVFSFIALVGIALESGMISLLVILAGAYIWYYPKVVEKEEAFLTHKFGEPYTVYTREVPRWIPNFKLWVEPEMVESMPRFLRRTMMDAIVFFLPLPGFAIVASLHAHALLPVWLTLP